MQKVIPIIILIIILIQGCATSRRAKVRGKVSNESSIKGGDIADKNVSLKGFYIQKALVTVTGNQTETKFLVTVKYNLPDSILISVRARIGYEAARIFLTNDTLIIADRINRKLRVGNPQFLKKKYGIEPAMLFIIMGDYISGTESRDKDLKCIQGYSESNIVLEGRNINYRINCSEGKIAGATFEGDITSGNIALEFKEFTNFDGLIMPKFIRMNNDLSQIKADMEIEKATGNFMGYVGGLKTGNSYDVIRIK